MMDTFVIEYEVPAFTPKFDARPAPQKVEFASDFKPNEVRWVGAASQLILGADQRWFVHVTCQGTTSQTLENYRFAWALEEVPKGNLQSVWAQVQDPTEPTTVMGFVYGPTVLRLVARYEKGQVRRVGFPNRAVEGDVDYVFQIHVARAEDVVHAFT